MLQHVCTKEIASLTLVEYKAWELVLGLTWGLGLGLKFWAGGNFRAID